MSEPGHVLVTALSDWELRLAVAARRDQFDAFITELKNQDGTTSGLDLLARIERLLREHESEPERQRLEASLRTLGDGLEAARVLLNELRGA